jgi:hypothetical protein
MARDEKGAGGVASNAGGAAVAEYVEDVQRKWWIGLNPTAVVNGVERTLPVQNHTIGAQEFSVFTDDTAVDPATKQWNKLARPGRVVDLTDADVARIKGDMKRHVVRFFGQRAQVLDTNGSAVRPYVSSRSDVPIAKFAYMKQVANDGSGVGGLRPESLEK